MVPAHFVVLEELPLTANGKLDRKALPVPEKAQGQTDSYLPPRNATEQALCEVLQEILKVEQVGIQDNFFSLGGDSILSIRVVAALKRKDILIDIKDVFQLQTVERLAARVMDNAYLLISKMSDSAGEQKEKLISEGKEIEEGVL
jgi:aryl carrier-like protein